VRIGIVSVWWNRGQATVARYLRTILDGLGHETFVLARPCRGFVGVEGYIAENDVWDQPGVTHASNFLIPWPEYLRWAESNSLEAVFCDMNFQFDCLARLRALGIRTIGRFVWETFKTEHVPGARDAFDVIYSLTRCEQARYAGLGIRSPWLPFGCHPELLAVEPRKFTDGIYLFAPASYQGPRKPMTAMVDAFKRVRSDNLRLVIKAQGFRKVTEKIEFRDDPRVQRIVDDWPTEMYQRFFSSCHVCLAPSRWEGLGLHLYEAIAFGLPIITNDIPPMNEIVRDGYNGILVKSRPAGQADSGIPAYDPDPEDLSRAIQAVADPGLVLELSRNTLERREQLSWDSTIEGFAGLLRADINAQKR